MASSPVRRSRMRALATLALKTVSCDLHHITSATDFTVSQSGRLSDG